MSSRQPLIRIRLCTAALAWLALNVQPAQARDLWSNDDDSYNLSLDSAFKTTWLASHLPNDPQLFAERESETSLLRMRFTLAATLGEHAEAQLAYEHRARFSSDASGLGGVGLLPPTGPSPFRVLPVEQTLIDEPHLLHYHQVDRAYVALHFSPLDLTIGRQAIGLGRGVLFSAVDVLAPFSPLEVDREWRRGIDAVHAELRLSDHFSTDVIGAAENAFRNGVLLARVRGFVDALDGALIGGKRDEDWMLGATGSAAVGDAEVHGEAALFHTDGRGIEQGWLGSRVWVAKFLAGASYQVDIGRGLRLLGEYHYSGFGLRNIGHDASLLSNPAYQARMQRVDSQLLGRHVVAGVASYDLSDEVTANLTALVSPVDGSGLVSPGFTLTTSDTVSVIAAGYIPWGKRPVGATIRSEYGSVGVTGLIQVRVYD